jgi:alkylhydroperoxidase family enzyme
MQPLQVGGPNMRKEYHSTATANYDLRTRELIIDRVTARCACEYEWGVHVAAYAKKAGITSDQAYSLGHGSASDPCWYDDDRLALVFANRLHDTGHVDDATWDAVRARFAENTLLELLALVGWYHAISYIANGARVERETWSTPFPARQWLQ